MSYENNFVSLYALKKRRGYLDFAAIILAAGLGKRMKSATPKVMHKICDKSMLSYVMDAVEGLSPERIVVVVGHGSKTVVSRIKGVAEPVFQDEQLGTGHAVMVTRDALNDYHGQVLILTGDTPLITTGTLKKLINGRADGNATAAVLTAKMEDPSGYGRMLFNEDKEVVGIVEERDATMLQKEIDIINTGMYCVDKDELFSALDKISNENDQNEYYLTDVIRVLSDGGRSIVSVLASGTEIMGVNSRLQLADAEEIMQRKIHEEHMVNGVTFHLPKTSFIGRDVTIGSETLIFPNSFIIGQTIIGKNCEIGPSAKIKDSTIGDKTTIQYSCVNDSLIDDNVDIGPFASLRPGTKISSGGKAGTFVELKKALIGKNSKVPHLSYIGDTKIGEHVNIGAGSITCNYDGVNKWEAVIEDDVFIGSDTMIISPVRIGAGAMTGAGSVISKDVPSGGLGIERSEQRNIEGWAKKHREKAAKKRKRGGTGKR